MLHSRVAGHSILCLMVVMRICLHKCICRMAIAIYFYAAKSTLGRIAGHGCMHALSLGGKMRLLVVSVGCLNHGQ